MAVSPERRQRPVGPKEGGKCLFLTAFASSSTPVGKRLVFLCLRLTINDTQGFSSVCFRTESPVEEPMFSTYLLNSEDTCTCYFRKRLCFRAIK